MTEVSPSRDMDQLTHEQNLLHLKVDWDRVPLSSKLEGFLVFHATHPEVFNLFVRYGRELRRRGKLKHNSARRILDRVRWDGVYVWEHYSPYYARLMAMVYPREFGKEFFTYRPSPADDLPAVIRRARNLDVDHFYMEAP